jgi:predicted permease
VLTTRLIDDLVRDVRFAARMLRRSPAFTVVAVVSLAIGIGAAGAVFSVLDTVVLRKLSVPRPEELVYLREHTPPARVNDELPYRRVEAWRDETRSFAALCTMNVFDRSNIGMNGDGGGVDPERARVEIVSASYFDVFRVAPAIGRAFTADEDRGWGAHPVAVVSEAYRRRRLGRDANVIGRSLTLNATTFSIIGVMPPSFTGEWVGRPIDVWVPWTMHPQVLIEQPGPLIAPNDYWLHVFARLKPGVTREQAEAEVQTVDQRTLKEAAGAAPAPETLRRLAQIRITVEPARRGYSPQRERLMEPLTILAIVVGLVLLVACANVASLVLARATQRRRELAVRLAIGAGPSRIARQVLTEGVMLSVIAGAFGLVLSFWGSRVLSLNLAASPVDMFWGRSSWFSFDDPVGPHGVVFAAIVSVVTGLVFGAGPLALARLSPAKALTGRGDVFGASRLRFGKTLVVFQVALSLTATIAAGLLVRSLNNLQRQDLGFRGEHVLLVWTQPSAVVQDPLPLRQLWTRVLDRLQALPGVVSASASNTSILSGTMPVSFAAGAAMRVEGQPPRPPITAAAGRAFIAPRFFETLGIPVIAGREFTDADTDAAPPVVIINETFARHYFGNENPVGRRVGFGPPSNGTPETVVGVVRDFEGGTPRAAGVTQFRNFYPYRDRESQRRIAIMMVAIRTAAEPSSMVSLVRQELRGAEPNLPVLRIDTVDEQLADVLAQDRLIAGLGAFFGSVALLLAGLGLYGLLAYMTARRTSEIGLRLALGATRAGVLGMVMRESVWLAAAGILAGIPIAVAVTRVLASRLFGVTPYDPLTLAAALASAAGVAAVAGLLPAQRAARVDPMDALRCE